MTLLLKYTDRDKIVGNSLLTKEKPLGNGPTQSIIRFSNGSPSLGLNAMEQEG